MCNVHVHVHCMLASSERQRARQKLKGHQYAANRIRNRVAKHK